MHRGALDPQAHGVRARHHELAQVPQHGIPRRLGHVRQRVAARGVGRQDRGTLPQLGEVVLVHVDRRGAPPAGRGRLQSRRRLHVGAVAVFVARNGNGNRRTASGSACKGSWRWVIVRAPGRRGAARDARHHHGARRALRLGEVQIVVLGACRCARRRGTPRRRLPAEVRHADARVEQGVEERRAARHADGFAGARDARRERRSGRWIDAHEPLAVQPVLWPPSGPGGPEHVVDHRGRSADGEVRADGGAIEQRWQRVQERGGTAGVGDDLAGAELGEPGMRTGSHAVDVVAARTPRRCARRRGRTTGTA